MFFKSKASRIIKLWKLFFSQSVETFNRGKNSLQVQTFSIPVFSFKNDYE